jgi:hypothetical protein
MATRSIIAQATTTGIRAIYCHWDGYPEHHMPILEGYYFSQDKVQELINLGSISMLGKYIGTAAQAACKYPDICIFYHRDLDYELDIHEVKDEKELQELGDDLGVDHVYLFENDEWKMI